MTQTNEQCEQRELYDDTSPHTTGQCTNLWRMILLRALEDINKPEEDMRWFNTEDCKIISEICGHRWEAVKATALRVKAGHTETIRQLQHQVVLLGNLSARSQLEPMTNYTDNLKVVL